MHQPTQERPPENFNLSSIGVIHTPYRHAQGVPIQGVAGTGAQGFVELHSELLAGLKDLVGFDRIWLIYLLHKASPVQMLVHPYMDTEERGVFATRSPARPNHLGLTAVRLLGIEGNRLLIADVDMLDGTPLLDIKPYVPAFDAFEQARPGWYAGKSATEMVADGRFEDRRDDHA